jgi:flagellar basal-body rod modification protein FlgD
MAVPPTSTGYTKTSTTTATSTKAQATPAKQTTLNYDTFLRLLMAQMKNQDPTSPMKSTEYMGQLATFSQVEQAVNTNSKLDALLASSALGQAGNLVGHTLTSADKTVSGTVVSVEVANNGLLAHLDNGQAIPYAPGMTVS